MTTFKVKLYDKDRVEVIIVEAVNVEHAIGLALESRGDHEKAEATPLPAQVAA